MSIAQTPHEPISMLSAALEYARSGYAVLPLWWPIGDHCACGEPGCKRAGKHPIGSLVPNGVTDASKDPTKVRALWGPYPNANIGVACGKPSGIAVADVDGAAGEATLTRLKEAHAAPPGDSTFQSITGRGRHSWYKYPESVDVNTRRLDGLELLSDGAYAVAPPSLHKSGALYAWSIDPESQGQPLPPLPEYLVAFARLGAGAFGNIVKLSGRRARNNLSAAAANLHNPPPETDYEIMCVRKALAYLPIEILDDRQHWLELGYALKWTRWECAREIWDECSKRSNKFDPIDQEKTWNNSLKETRDDRAVITLGTLFALAKQHGYTPPLAPIPVENDEPEPVKSQISVLNERYFVIKNLGGKAVIGEFIDSPDGKGKSLSVMSQASFKLAYLNQRVGVVDPEKNVRRRNLANYWLAHPVRHQYEGVDLDPNGPPTLPGNKLNLWQGWGVEAKPGDWSKMHNHIYGVIAGGDQETAQDVLRWLAWKVQHPGERPEIALGLQGEMGCGKGIFVHNYASLFGPHSQYISNQEQLTGRFNGHLEGKLIVFSDEAFWAGDKRGESTIKSIITEAIMPVERKGIDVYQAKNRMALIFGANNEWVVPAGGGERRFLVLECNNRYAKGRIPEDERNRYFEELLHEMERGGREAMLYDLKHWDLGRWHPRQARDTEALRTQKRLSLLPVMQWIELFLREGRLHRPEASMLFQIPAAQARPSSKDGPEKQSPANYFVSNDELRTSARERVPLLRNVGDSKLLDALTKLGCTPGHSPDKSRRGRTFPTLGKMRSNWEKVDGLWRWESADEDWS